ncbi:MAG: hypothetical protein ONB12_09215 [candidate division KSB1 bacterium]|nr:hypothetical protein [candidate division KSB1 bacterium]
MNSVPQLGQLKDNGRRGSKDIFPPFLGGSFKMGDKRFYNCGNFKKNAMIVKQKVTIFT